MLLLPLIYLKQGKALQPPGTTPPWFSVEPIPLANTLLKQGATGLYIQDLSLLPTGKSENLPLVQTIISQLGVQVWLTGNFRSLSAIESYVTTGVAKINVGALAYQNPNLFQEACQKFPQKIIAPIEVHNKHVVIPGMVTPAHKTAQDYAKRFEETGAAALAYSDSDLSGIKEFCNQVKVPVLSLNDVTNTGDLEKMFDCERAGLVGVVMGKSLYENRLDLHSSIAFLNDLVAATAQEPTLTED